MAVTFSDAITNGCVLVISPNTKQENEGMYLDARVDRKTVPEDWFVYDIRHGDNVYFYSLEPFVLVNHAGSFLTQKAVKMNKKGYHCLCHGAGYTFL